MRQNLEQTIQREREKAKNQERRENAKEFEKIYDLEEKLRIAEVSSFKIIWSQFVNFKL
jgi:hypothetical protein